MDEIAPILLSSIVCDRVIFDRISGMPSIINIIQAINAPKYPVRHDQLIFFCEMTNGHGVTPLKIRLVDIDNQDKVIFEQGQPVADIVSGFGAGLKQFSALRKPYLLYP